MFAPTARADRSAKIANTRSGHVRTGGTRSSYLGQPLDQPRLCRLFEHAFDMNQGVWLATRVHLLVFFRENVNMANFNWTIAAVGLLAACGVACISPASAQVARPQIGQGTSVPADLLTEVQYRGRWGGPGPGIGFGIAAGALLGAAIAGPYGPYYGYPGYYGPPGYYPPPPPPPGDPVAYCMSRFRSYDPASGSYLGFDGLRHPCP